jgi:outer membrane protein OmpA-like peptidoglycan-associated protein
MIVVRALLFFMLFGMLARSGFAADEPASVGNLKTQVLDLVFKVEDLGGKVQDLGGKIQDLQLKESDTEIRIELAADVLFDFDKADVRRDAQKALKQVADIIREKAKGPVRIEGHTDSKGSDAYNQKLSERRANSIKDWLIKQEGLRNMRFSTSGLGAKKPAVSNTQPDGSDDPAGRQKNRRVEIVISKKG